MKWSCAQWMPFPLESLSRQWQEDAWDYWESQHHTGEDPNFENPSPVLEIPRVQVQEFSNPNHLLQHVVDTYGENWRERPLLFQNLWSQKELQDSSHTRRISKAGLLKENLTVPYFTDARIAGAITPDGQAPIQDIVANITLRSAPHKIGSQLLLETYPELIYEVAPNAIVTTLFGNHFQPQHVVGFWGLPSLTTIPFFVAGITRTNHTTTTTSTHRPPHAFTALHCEPIGNVAVQLEGEKHWTLVSPQHSFRMKPSSSPDGRAFYVSGHSSDDELGQVPRYYATTGAGDAIWIPTWTWHRVDYSSPNSINDNNNQSNIAIGASLFHLRPLELVQNNPLFAFLAIPSLIKEVLRINTQ